MGTKSPKISVIVPIYNAQNTIARCIESLLGQTFTDFELLLINDGSVDNSGKICERYANDENRIKVYHKKNGGPNSARKYGLERSCGDYVIFPDSDDWFEEDYIKGLYDSLISNSAEISVCGFYEEYKTYKIEHRSGKDFDGLSLRLINRNLLNSAMFRFEAFLCEDKMIFYLLKDKCPKIVYFDVPLYHWDRFSIADGLTRSFSFERYKKGFSALTKIKREFNNLEIYKDLCSEFIPQYAHAVVKYNVLSPSDFRKEFRRYKKILLQSALPVQRKIMIIMYYCGFKKITSRMTKIYSDMIKPIIRK